MNEHEARKELDNAIKDAIFLLVRQIGAENDVAWIKQKMKCVADNLNCAAATEEETTKRESMLLNGMCPIYGGDLKHYNDGERTRIVCADHCLGWHVLKEIENAIGRCYQNRNNLITNTMSRKGNVMLEDVIEITIWKKIMFVLLCIFVFPVLFLMVLWDI